MTLLIGYGSYLNETERAQEGFENAQPGFVFGWERIFNKVTESGRWPSRGERRGVMNVRRTEDPDARLNVMIMQVTTAGELESHTREGLDSVGISHYNLEDVVAYDDAGNELGPAKMYVANPLVCRRDVLPVDLYFFVCLEGARQQGDFFYESYLDNTIVQWQGVEMTVRDVLRLNAEYNQIQRPLDPGVEGDPTAIAAMRDIIDSPFLPDQVKFLWHRNLIRKIVIAPYPEGMEPPTLLEMVLSLEQGGKGLPALAPGGPHGGKQQAWGWTELKLPKIDITVHPWIMELYEAGITQNLYQLLLHEVAHVHPYDAELSLRFGGQSDGHITCDEAFKFFFDRAVKEAEVLEEYIKREDCFPPSAQTGGEQVAWAIPEGTLEIMIRPFGKMNRIDGEVVLRRQLLRLTPLWEQWMWKVSKWDRENNIIYTYYKFEHELPEDVYEAVAFLNTRTTTRRQKTKRFDDGTEFVYLSTSRANYVSLARQPTSAPPTVEVIPEDEPTEETPEQDISAQDQAVQAVVEAHVLHGPAYDPFNFPTF